MKSGKRTMLIHLGIVSIVGILLAMFLGFEGKPDPESQARAMVPEELTVGKIIIGQFGEESDAAVFKIEGPAPASMQSLEVRETFGLSRTPRQSVRKVNWTNTGPHRTYRHASFRDCSCFACVKDAKICEKASDWLNKEGSLFFINADPDGTSYLMNRDLREIIVVWKRPI